MKKTMPPKVKIDLVLLKKYADEGLYCYEIGKLLGFPKDTIKVHAKKNGIKVMTNQEAVELKKQKIKELINNGTETNTMRAMGYSYELIMKTSKEFGLKTRTRQDGASDRSTPINEFLKALEKSHGDSIKLVESTYINSHKKATFIDKDYGSFERIAREVAFLGKGHPKRGRLSSSISQAEYTMKNGESIRQFSMRTGMSYTHMLHMCQRHGVDFVEQWVAEYKDNTSELELKIKNMKFSDNIEIKHIGKKSNGEIPKTKEDGVNSNKFWRPDFKLTNFENKKVIFVEADGLRAHSIICRPDERYHINKRVDFERAGFDVLQFRQDEIVFKSDVVNSVISSKLGVFEKKFFARNLQIKSVSYEASCAFFNDNHLMGKPPSSKCFGLFNDDELVCAMAYKKKDEGVDITRFCSKKGYSIAGGLSRLLKQVEVMNPDAKYIIYFIDLRYGNGRGIESLGFKLESSNVGFQWTDSVFTYNRLQCTANMDDRNLSEAEYAAEKKLVKIYDAGQAKYVKHL